MAGDQDLAVQAVGRIAHMWRIDDTKIMRTTESETEGFDWWPGDFRVRARAERSKIHDTVRLIIRTDFLKEIPIADERFISLVAETSPLATSTYAWVYPPAPFWEQYHKSGFDVSGLGPKLGFSSSAYISSENIDWLPDLLARASIMQPVDAQIQSGVVPKMIGGGVPDVSRPDTPKDDGLDEILDVADQVYVPRGKQPSRWAGTGEFESFTEKWGKSDSCFGFGDEKGLTVETPFGDHSALIRLQTEQKHPQLGNGLLATLQLPYSGDNLSTAKDAATLNLNESAGWTDFPLIGCWHSRQYRDDDCELVFSSFIPNSLYQSGLATEVAFWLLKRARWAREKLYPDVVDKTMLEIVKSRFPVKPKISRSIFSAWPFRR
jgi:hypothetical protein